MDPLEILPAEIILRIIDFSHISTVAALTRLTRSWHSFIEEAHREAIYCSPSKTSCPNARRDLSFLAETQSFAKYFDGTTSWKDLCRRQTLLNRNWNDKEPLTRESIIQVGNDAVWRFRVDWKRRLIVSTSQQGGLNVTDLDTGNLLWRLSNDEVRPFSHLEYEDGIAVFDREYGSCVEVWKTGFDDLPRGTFQRTAILPHECIIRGFQLSYNTLCVVSTQGEAFVYDMSAEPPRTKTHLTIEEDATGHVCQDPEVVMYCMGNKGYHIHNKESGALLGVVDPARCQKFYHILHPDEPRYSIVSTGSSFSSLPSVDIFPPREPTRDRLSAIEIRDGSYKDDPDGSNRSRIELEAEEWGGGILSGSKMVGISRGGRMFVCPDWKAALREPKRIEFDSYLIECDADTSSFHVDFGGWLSVRDDQALFEVQDRVYVISLDRGSSGRNHRSQDVRPSYSFTTSSATQLAAPVSFMGLYDDCIMSTYTTLGWRRRTEPADMMHLGEQTQRRDLIFAAKTIRILSLAPSLDADDTQDESPVSATPSNSTHANILEIMNMISDEEDDEFEGESG